MFNSRQRLFGSLETRPRLRAPIVHLSGRSIWCLQDRGRKNGIKGRRGKGKSPRSGGDEVGRHDPVEVHGGAAAGTDLEDELAGGVWACAGDGLVAAWAFE